MSLPWQERDQGRIPIWVWMMDNLVFLVSLPPTPSMPSSGTSTIRTRASGRRTTGTMTTEATPGTHRGAPARSSQCALEALPASSTSAHLGPLRYPTGSVVLGDGSSQGCRLQPTASPCEGLLPHTGPGIFLWIQTGNNDLLFSVCTPSFLCRRFLLLFLPSSFLAKDPTSLGRTVRLQWLRGRPFLSPHPSPAAAPQLPRP